jgi:ubiquinone/menaquinone biosynthesis C-methylase UbiE
MDESESVRTHYSTPSLQDRVTSALSAAGLDDRPVTWEDLAPLDQFHVRGLAATRELAAELNMKAGAKVLDVGCGIGGASRFLAATYGVQVTGIDLTPSFIDVARILSERAGLSDRVVYRVADATKLPFADSSFDYAWTQHVAMNIRDRDGLYSEVFRVLKPGGSFAIHDIVQTSDEPLIFPVPWARGPEASFLLSPDGMRDALTQAGFEVVSWHDTTEATGAWISQMRSARAAGSKPPALGLHVITAADFATMIGNLGRNLSEGRVGVVQAIVRSPIK